MPTFDPFSYEIHEDPYPSYRALRDEAPAYWNEQRRFWALSRYDDVKAAVTDWATFSSAQGITLEREADALEPMLIEMDPPRHTQLRALVSHAFTPKRVADLESPCRELARELIDNFARHGRCDLIQDFSALLPMAVISKMLGVPRDDQDELRHWSDTMLHKEAGESAITDAGLHAGARVYEYFDRLITARRSEPGDDLVSALLEAEVDGLALTNSEVLGFCFLLLIAGNETTTKLIGNAMYWLHRTPEQRDKLVADPTLIPQALEEVLRYDSSTQAMARTMSQPLELHSETLRENDKVLLLFGSANRDERHWENADEFDVLRNPAGHLAFGHGIHHCLGAALARLEGRVALQELLAAIPDYVVDEAGLARVHSGNVRGFTSVPLTFT